MNLQDKVKAMVAALEDIKARDILVLDTTPLTSLFDRVIIASSDSARQTRSLARSVHDKAAELGLHIIGMEGEEGAEWILVDLGDIVVHVMQAAARQYYNLEELWGGGTSSKEGPHVVGIRTSASAATRRHHDT
ncbi:MAG: ribosome silencing factor [Thiobacillaceae bacterium]